MQGVGRFHWAADGSTVSTGDRSAIVVEWVVIIILSRFHITTRGSTQGIQFSGELGLRLDERATVVAHGLVTSVWILRHNGVYRGEQNQDQEDQRKHGIVNEEDDTHDTDHHSGGVEHIREHEQEDGVDEIDHRNGDVENVGLLIHPRTENADRNKHA